MSLFGVDGRIWRRLVGLPHLIGTRLSRCPLNHGALYGTKFRWCRGAENNPYPGKKDGGGEYVHNGAHHPCLRFRFFGRTLGLSHGESDLGRGSLNVEQ